MLFNSYEFIFFFMPITLFVFFLIGVRGHHRIAIAWLVGTSLFFYAWWNPAYLGLIFGSMLFNYSIGVALSNQRKRENAIVKKGILILGVATNLGALGYFKYANFFVDTVNRLFGTPFHPDKIILPLAISFFTFNQLAYLADAYSVRQENIIFFIIVCL